MRTQHPLFAEPEDLDASLWRYMDFVKFVSMLMNGGLFFIRADKLGDPFEGSFPRANKAVRRQRWMERLPQGSTSCVDLGRLLREIAERTQQSRPLYLINCWHLNDHESAAMWSLYGGKGDSIAVKTTFRQLCEALPEKAHVGKVQYIDYDTQEVPEWNGFVPYVHKRASYRHETEVRAVMKLRESTTPNPDLLPDVGTWIKTDLHRLINSVHIAPASANWLQYLVRDISSRYGYSFPVEKSQMDQKPFY